MRYMDHRLTRPITIVSIIVGIVGILVTMSYGPNQQPNLPADQIVNVEGDNDGSIIVVLTPPQKGLEIFDEHLNPKVAVRTAERPTQEEPKAPIAGGTEGRSTVQSPTGKASDVPSPKPLEATQRPLPTPVPRSRPIPVPKTAKAKRRRRKALPAFAPPPKTSNVNSNSGFDPVGSKTDKR